MCYTFEKKSDALMEKNAHLFAKYKVGDMFILKYNKSVIVSIRKIETSMNSRRIHCGYHFNFVNLDYTVSNKEYRRIIWESNFNR